MLAEILKDPERKPLTGIFKDNINLLIHYRETPVHYFSRYLFKKGTTNIRDYIPNQLAEKIAPALNDGKAKEVLDNKLYFSLFYGQFGIPLPKILMFNHLNRFVVGSSPVTINTYNDFRSLTEDVFGKNPGCTGIFIKKTYSSSSGRNIYAILRTDLNSNDQLIRDVYSGVKDSGFIFQEKVKQHPDLERLSPTSLNTIRFDTFIDDDGNIEVISGFMKMSTNEAVVDNGVSGGCAVGVDMESGRLKRNGYSKIKISGVDILTEHPLTGIRFEGYLVPFFHEARDLVAKAASYMPDLRLVGWDVGIGESGPVLIEGNSDYGINSNDLMYGGYMANETFRKVIRAAEKKQK
jgi:hypothetical protein